jgi:hypothetical protein
MIQPSNYQRTKTNGLITRHWAFCLTIALATLVCSINLHAQVDPTMLLTEWEEGPHWAQSYDEPLFFNKGSLKDGGPSINLWRWDSEGVVNVNRNDPDPDLTFGYRYLTMSIDTDAALPIGMENLAIVGAYRFKHEQGQLQWRINGGMGTANDTHYSNSDALYGVAAINGTHEIDESSRLHFGISYLGNRSLYPDIPLPYVTYEHQASDQLSYRVGVLNSSLEWKLSDAWSIQVEHDFPLNFRGGTVLTLNDQWSLFAEYVHSIDSIYLDGMNNTRLFYDLNRVDAGFRWKSEWIDLTVGMGYAFDQRFDTGFDIRQRTNAGRPSDEIFLMIAVQGTF